MSIIKPKAISGFPERLPAEQMIEDRFKDIIRKNYNLGGFTNLDTPSIERVETLTSKGADDNEIYAIKRLKAELDDKTNFELGLRFDLTVPLARYVAMYEGELTFPFRRQHIAKVWRGERPQKGRYREFYQADVDIIGNGKLAKFADVEILETIYNTLRQLDFGAFCININNKKFLSGLLESFNIKNTSETISVIDKKDKVNREKLSSMFKSINLDDNQITKIIDLIDFSEKKDMSNAEILDYYKTLELGKSELLTEGLEELSYTYTNLLALGVDDKYLKLNLAISRGLNYYTGLVYETFINGYESMGSVSSGGRYENLASNFTKNNFPGVGGSIGVSRLIAVLKEIGELETGKKTPTDVIVLFLEEKDLSKYLDLIKVLRHNGVNCELYLDPSAKIQKQFKYAENKKIPFAVIAGEDELSRGVVALKNLNKREQEEIKISNLVNILKEKLK